MANINDILKDPESLQNIKELADMFKDEFNLGDGKDIMSMVGGLFGGGQNNKNTDLLLALKPHLSEEKQYKVDKAIKLLGMVEIFLVLNESGALNELL
ncbi:hypothetical protein FACS1894132_08890 [Clostridia bacterium]|nr:hypothetical protein FACS1894132_08890 [Clostridia bacterium]